MGDGWAGTVQPRCCGSQQGEYDHDPAGFASRVAFRAGHECQLRGLLTGNPSARQGAPGDDRAGPVRVPRARGLRARPAGEVKARVVPPLSCPLVKVPVPRALACGTVSHHRQGPGSKFGRPGPASVTSSTRSSIDGRAARCLRNRPRPAAPNAPSPSWRATPQQLERATVLDRMKPYRGVQDRIGLARVACLASPGDGLIHDQEERPGRGLDGGAAVACLGPE